MPKQERWSQKVTESSHALDLESGVFALEDPRQIALSLKKSAEQSTRRKSDPYRSAMSMLTFYINRAGAHLSAEQRERLEKAKDELRVLFGRSACHSSTRVATGSTHTENANISHDGATPMPKAGSGKQ